MHVQRGEEDPFSMRAGVCPIADSLLLTLSVMEGAECTLDRYSVEGLLGTGTRAAAGADAEGGVAAWLLRRL